MTGHEKGLLERQSLSEVKMGRHAPVCIEMHVQTANQFWNNAPCKIVRTWDTSPSTINNIKIFRDS